jgi:hypothetical protein
MHGLRCLEAMMAQRAQRGNGRGTQTEARNPIKRDANTDADTGTEMERDTDTDRDRDRYRQR